MFQKMKSWHHTIKHTPVEDTHLQLKQETRGNCNSFLFFKWFQWGFESEFRNYEIAILCYNYKPKNNVKNMLIFRQMAVKFWFEFEILNWRFWQHEKLSQSQDWEYTWTFKPPKVPSTAQATPNNKANTWQRYQISDNRMVIKTRLILTHTHLRLRQYEGEILEMKTILLYLKNDFLQNNQNNQTL